MIPGKISGLQREISGFLKKTEKKTLYFGVFG